MLEVSGWVLDRVEPLSWQGVDYRAAPPELAFLPKAAGYIARRGRHQPEVKHLEDLRRLQRLVRWDVVERLLVEGGLRWRGRPLPAWAAKRLDPFPADEILSLRAAVIA